MPEKRPGRTIAMFDAKPYDRTSFDEVNQAFGFDITYFETRLSPGTMELAHGYDAVCAFVNDVINKEVIDFLASREIPILALRCAGYNNVDFRQAFNCLHIVRVPAYSPYAVAEHAAALILTLNRKTHKAYYRTRDGNFNITGLTGMDLHNKTAGVIGTGKIGRCLISILNGFGMNVLAYDLYPNETIAKSENFTYTTLDDIFARSDVISLHCPLTPDTRYLINENSIAKLKNGVMLINTGRGHLIDTKAMIQALKSGKIGSAGLDVYEEESDYFFEDLSSELIADDVLARLLTFPNVLVTSHQGFLTKEALRNIAETTLTNLSNFFEKGLLQNEICYRCTQTCPKDKQNGEPCFSIPQNPKDAVTSQ